VSGDPIADYLAELRAGLRTSPARTAEIVAEAEDHLRESAAAGRAGGLGEEAAQCAAISAFGPVEQVSRAHRPPVSAYAAAVGLRAWPLLGGYLLLSGLIGALLLWDEMLTSHGHSMAPAVAVGGFGRRTIYVLDGSPHPGQVAATIGGCVLAGALLLAGFLIVRRHRRRSGLASARLPRGVFGLAAAFVLLALGIAENQNVGNYGVGSLPAVTGTYELVTGSLYTAMLMGVGCGLWALNSLTGRGNRRREPAVGRDTSGRTQPRARRSRVAASIGMTALQLLGGYVLLSAMTGGLLAYLDVMSSRPSPPDFGLLSALIGGCGLAGMVLLAAFAIVGRRRRSRAVPATPPRGLALLISAAALLALGIAEYRFFGSDVMGRLHIPNGAADLLLGSQWAAVLMGVGWALRTLASLVNWAVTSWSGRGRQVPPESGSLAPIG
jgi:hypothetical protein